MIKKINFLKFLLSYHSNHANILINSKYPRFLYFCAYSFGWIKCHQVEKRCTKTSSEQILSFHQIFLLKITSSPHFTILDFMHLHFQHYSNHQNFALIFFLQYFMEHSLFLINLILLTKNEKDRYKARECKIQLQQDYMHIFYQVH